MTNNSKIPAGFREPIEPDDTEAQEQEMLNWTRSLVGDPVLTDKQQKVLDKLNERRANGA